MWRERPRRREPTERRRREVPGRSREARREGLEEEGVVGEGWGRERGRRR